MSFNRLKWDSDFFGFDVYITHENSISAIQNDINKIWDISGKLIYAINTLDIERDFLVRNGGKYVGTKLLFSKKPILNSDFLYIRDIEYNILPKDLLDLAFQSGVDSRFRIDNRLPKGTFERMYILWMEKSINNPRIKTFVYKVDNKNLGFITLEINSIDCQVGLFAVDKSSRGKGIGKQLLNYAENYASENGFDEIIIPTQKENKQACLFYQSRNYKNISETKVYHFINKKDYYDSIQ